jgi:hypothetical protein
VRSVAGLAAVAARQGHLERAAHLQAATLRFGRMYGVVFPGGDRADHQRLVNELRAQLGPERFGAASGNDTDMTFDEYVAAALALPG